MEKYLIGISKWIEKKGRRVGFTDAGKRRDIIQRLGESKQYPSYHRGWECILQFITETTFCHYTSTK